MTGKWTKGKFFEKILLHNECKIEDELEKQIIKRYKEGALKTEKLSGHDSLYSIKLNYKERLLAKLDNEKNLMIFEHDKNHQYNITKKQIDQQDCKILLDKEPKKLFLSKNGHYIRFDERQTSIIEDVTTNRNTDLNVHLVSGIAGAGKTLIAQYLALEGLEEKSDKDKGALYVTKSSKLLQEVKNSLPENFDAKDVNTVITPYLKKKGDFHTLFENEFNSAIEYYEIVGEFPGRKYLDVTKSSSLKSSYDNFKASTNNEIYSISKIARNKKYNLILIDEGQDLTPYELLTLSKMATSYGKVVIFYDQNQLLSGINFNMKQLFSKLVKNPEQVTEHKEMHHTYRNPPQVQNLITKLFNKDIEGLQENKEADGYVKWTTSINDEFKKEIQRDIILNPLEFLVIIYDKTQKDAAIDTFSKNALILTVEEVKGLEFKRVIVFDFPKLDQSDENYSYIRNAYNIAISRSTEGVEMVFQHYTNGNNLKSQLGHNNDLIGTRTNVKKLTIESLIEELEKHATAYSNNSVLSEKIDETVSQHFKSNPNDISEFKAWLDRDDADNKIYNTLYVQIENNHKTQIEEINLTKLTNNYNEKLKTALVKFSNSDMLKYATNNLIKNITDSSSKCQISNTLLPSFDKLALIEKKDTKDIFYNKYKVLNNIPEGEFLSKFKEASLNSTSDGYLFNEINYLETLLIKVEAWIINIFVQDNLSKFKKLAQDYEIDIGDINNIQYNEIGGIRKVYKQLALKIHPDKNIEKQDADKQFAEFFELAKSIEKGELHSNSSINTLSEKVATYMNYAYLLDSGLKITDRALSFDKDNILGKNTLMLGIEFINLFLISNRVLHPNYLIASNISKVIAENWDEDEGVNYIETVKDLSITAGVVAATSKVAKLTLAISTLSIPALSYSIYYSACSVSNKILKLTEEYRASWNTYIWSGKTNSKATKKSVTYNKSQPINIEVDTNEIIDAISKGDQKTVDNFITQVRDVNQIIGKNGYTSLAYAVHYKNIKMVKFLLDKNANINSRDSQTRTPLQSAIDNKYNEIAKYLIKRGADINTQNNKGYTPSMTAVGTNNEEILTELIAEKADLNIQDLNKETALTYAAYKGYLWAVNMLIKAGANYNLRDYNGDTALMIAVDKGHLEIAKTLIEAGIDISIKDKTGADACSIAKSKNNKEIVTLLKEKGANCTGTFIMDTRDYRGLDDEYANTASESPIYNDWE